MQTRKNSRNGDELSILGFGCMRLPTKGSAIDEEKAIALIRSAADRGINYFDTAWPYHGGKSEPLLGKALGDGYREKVKVATKLPQFMIKNLEKAKKIFDTQLERLDTDYIDYYLLHMLADKAGFDRLKEIGIIEWLEDLKNQGKIRNLGFSFHGVQKGFTELIQAYDWDFCQIQYNYLDENNQAGKAGLELAYSLNIPVIVMEPLRGGQLVNQLPKEIRDLYEKTAPGRSAAAWSLRWIWNHPAVTVVLSGMGTQDQLDDNIATASEMHSASMPAVELKLYENVKQILYAKTKIPCTGCAYCMPCPAGVNIPQVFSLYNEKYLMDGKREKYKYMTELGVGAKQPGFASLCIQCGKCEEHCPQSISIRQELKTVRKEMEGIFFKPMTALIRRLTGVR